VWDCNKDLAAAAAESGLADLGLADLGLADLGLADLGLAEVVAVGVLGSADMAESAVALVPGSTVVSVVGLTLKVGSVSSGREVSKAVEAH